MGNESLGNKEIIDFKDIRLDAIYSWKGCLLMEMAVYMKNWWALIDIERKSYGRMN
jgi:hypothetical protein